MQNEKVSAIMPVYNREKYLDEAIKSVLNIDYSNIELIIVNDGSTDNSLEICKSYAKKYPDIVKLIDIKENTGAGNAFDIAMKNATGKYICVTASDDVQHKDRFKICLETLQKHVDITMVFCNYEAINSKGQLIGRSLHIPKEINNSNLLNHQLRRNYMFSGLCLMRNIPDIQYDKSLRVSVDYDMFLKLIYKGYKAIFLDKILYYYRIHDENISAKYNNSRETVKYILNKFKVEDLLKRLREDEIDNKNIYITLGIMHLTKEEYDKSVMFLQRALEYDNCSKSDLQDNLFYLASAYYYNKKYNEAYDCLKKNLEIEQKNPTVFNNIGVLEYNMGNIEKASYYFGKAIEQQPLYMDAKANIEAIKNNLIPLRYTKNCLRKHVIHTENSIF